MKVYAGLRIMSFDAKVDELSSLLRLTPTKTWKKRASTEPNTPAALGKTNGWCLESCLLDGDDISEHLQWLIANIRPAKKKLKQLRQTGYLMDIYCMVFCEYGASCMLSASELRSLASLDVDFEIHFIANSGTI